MPESSRKIFTNRIASTNAMISLTIRVPFLRANPDPTQRSAMLKTAAPRP